MEEVTPEEEPTLSEEEVLSFIKNKYGKDITSLDEFTATPESSEGAVDLPEEVSAYLQYKETTGRGMSDYLIMNRNLVDMDGDTLLKEYLIDTEVDLDAEDVEDLLAEYDYDEDTDSDVEVRKIKRAKKRAIAKAKEYFAEQSKMYKEPTEMVSNAMSSEDAEGLEAYRQSIEDAKSAQEANELRSQAFSKATDNVFHSDFKGFDFDVDGNTLSFSVGTAEELKDIQSTPMNFINKFTGEDGTINDAAGYHKALAVAMNPEKFAQFFFEQGQANAKGDVLRTTKNINMSTRTAPEVSTTQGGLKVRALPTTHGRGLKVKTKS